MEYEAPERIDILVHEPLDVEDQGKKLYTLYKITTTTNLPNYKSEHFSVRRRYSEFVSLRAHLMVQVANSPKTKGSLRKVPELPGRRVFDRFNPAFIKERREGLESFLNKCAGHAICRLEKGLIRFLEDQDFDPKTLPS